MSTLGSSVVEVRDAIATSTARVDELDQAITPLSEQPAMAPPTIDPLLPPHGPTMDELATKLADVTALVAEQQQHLANVALVATDAAAHVGSAASPDLTPPRDTDAETRAQVGQLAEKVASIDSRLHQISLELTNQLTELSNDIDAAALQPGTPDSNAVLEEIERLMAERIDPTLVDITDGQERLATEQARYAISFREDLADLADKLAVPRQR